MSKVKMRCGRCGKQFRPVNTKQTLCPDCEIKARQERAVAKTATAGGTSGGRPTAAVPAPKIVGPGATILVPGAAPTHADVPPDTGLFGSAALRQEHATHDHVRRDQQPSSKGTADGHNTAPGQRPTYGKGEHAEKHPDRAAHPPKRERAPQAPRPPRQPKPPTLQFELTDELRQRIEARYIELAQPLEFDGIRTQIAGEMSIPKHVVKRAVLDLRNRKQMPSWWELQAYTGGDADLDRIRTAYLPHLPLAAVGIHKQIANDLNLDPAVVYHGIQRVRAELRLPRYNPPELHEQQDTAPVADGVPAASEPEAVSGT